LANADGTALGNALLYDWYFNIFVRVIVVHNQHRLGDEHIPLYVDAVLGGDNAVSAEGAIVLNYNHGLTCGVLGGDVEPRAIS